MDKTYNPHAIEQRWYQTWEDKGYFAPSGEGQPYCIMIPPPNVTGSLHMGHAFQDTIMDALTRFHRMRGDNTLWQAGSDHAGIATQMVVERQLNAEGKTRHDLGREAFIKRIWEWKAESGGTITRQLRRMGASLDWSRERFTMDAGLSEAVREVFVRLYEEGLIYRGQRLVNWDPVLHTAVSDLEVISEEEQGHMWHMRYPLSDGSGHLIVATTRPETMLGDTAVAVHPEDERYQKLIGKSIALPLTDREIPIIADDYVDPEFGTGCVKITPAHDFNDYEVGRRHDLPMINIFTVDAAINNNGPAKYQGLDRYEARDAIVHDLKELDLLEKIDDHKLMVPRGDRSGVVIEPYLTDQWFVDLTRDQQADGRPGGRARITIPAIEAVESGRIRFVPDNWKNTYYEWMRNIQDWCISRQIWWGHRIPCWYDEAGNGYVARNEQEAIGQFLRANPDFDLKAALEGFTHQFEDQDALHDHLAAADSVESQHDAVHQWLTPERYTALAEHLGLKQDDDVLDTWFSSALWPFSTLGWPEPTEALKTWYPTSVLVTGFDIIFFWVARMIMMGQTFMDDVPFREVYIHGLVRDAHGQKMSKSKGNVLDPIDLIDGIELDALVEKRTRGLMQPQMAKKIDKQTRKDFPDGIPAFGTDALRFTFAALASTGRDINFDLGRIEGYRNFCNKLWNAARYVLMNTEGQDCGQLENKEVELTVADRWILARLQQAEAEVIESIQTYRLDHAAQAIYEFTWNEYCDWYLELSKPVLNNPDSPEALQRGTRQTLVQVLETLLRLAHPLMPFITEEIWQRVAPLAGVEGETLMRQPFPAPDADLRDEAAVKDMDWVMQFILGVRKIRSGYDIKPSQPLPVVLENSSEQDRARLKANRHYIEFLARTESITPLEEGAEPPEAATALVGEMKVLIPLAGLIDKAAELERLTKEIEKKEQDLERVSKKLENESFVSKAPEAVVQKEREKAEETRTALTNLRSQKEKIAAL